MSVNSVGCCGPEGCGGTRREFLKASGIVGLSLAAPLVAGPFARRAAGAEARELIPADKKLDAEWVKALFAKGAPKVYRGAELATIGMPCGGIAAGQMYLSGDGRLAYWDIFNYTQDTGPGSRNYEFREPEFPVDQGFEITVRSDGKSQMRRLGREAFGQTSFVGEYPIGTVSYEDANFPARITLEAFSPFIPLNAADSALPATVLCFTIANTTDRELQVELRGWLENAVLRHSQDRHAGLRRNRIQRTDVLTMLECTAEPHKPREAAGLPEVFADFERPDWGDWKAEGEAFGAGPARGTLPNQNPVSGFKGKGLVNSFVGGDKPTGKLISPKFEIRRPFINFFVGGGAHEGKTCMNLIVGGKVVRTATGRNSEKLEAATWNVKELVGNKAHIEIVDDESGPWGHINVDQIEFADEGVNMQTERDFGSMALAVMGEAVGADATAPLDTKLTGSLRRALTLKPNTSEAITFLLTWYFPNRPDTGHQYGARFPDAASVARYIADNFDRLYRDTKLWHDTYYDCTLPHWLLDRIHMPVSTLATSTVQWWKDGRFWSWEGVGCCHGTCTHVWNYAQTMARLFPELERSARERQDFGAGFHEDGLVGFRGGNEYAADGQAGTILKAYREHLFSADDQFLKRNWPRIKKAMAFLIKHDGDEDGLIEDPQHNTYDIWFHGPNTFVGSLYLGALRASEEMARLMGDNEFATQCRKIFKSGSKLTDQKLFDGEYYYQQVDLAAHPQHQYDHGCLADQLFGQNWASQLSLGYLYEPANIRRALASIYRYNWTPDLTAYSKAHPPGRWFARAGEAGLITCTFPKSKYLDQGVLYREEVWTGIEYQVASHMIHEGMLTEAVSVLRGIHERYDASKHNPWNEIECGDHYARALASWACLTALSGFEYDGPAGHIAFAPRITPQDFRCLFTTAAGWGTFMQNATSAEIHLKWGTLRLSRLSVALAAGKLQLNGKTIEARSTSEQGKASRTFPTIIMVAGDRLEIL